jgi:hypothetical protein
MDVDEGGADPTSDPESEEGVTHIEVSISLSDYRHRLMHIY